MAALAGPSQPRGVPVTPSVNRRGASQQWPRQPFSYNGNREIPNWLIVRSNEGQSIAAKTGLLARLVVQFFPESDAAKQFKAGESTGTVPMFEKKKYAKSAFVASAERMDIDNNNYAPNAGGSDDGSSDDETEEEAQSDAAKRRKLEAEGAQNALTRKRNFPPVEVVQVMKPVTKLLRKSWKYGQSQSILSQWTTMNAAIRSACPPKRKSSAALPQAQWEIPATVLDHVQAMYPELWSYLEKYTDPTAREQATNHVSILLIGLIQQLDKFGLSWKTAVEPDIYDLLDDMFREGTDLWRKAGRADAADFLMEYLKEDPVAAFPHQIATAQQSKEDWEEALKALESDDQQGALVAVKKLHPYNQQLMEGNQEICLKPSDHSLPIDFLEREIRDSSKDARKKVCTILFYTGFNDLAEVLKRSEIQQSNWEPRVSEIIEKKAIEYKNPVDAVLDIELDKSLGGADSTLGGADSTLGGAGSSTSTDVTDTETTSSLFISQHEWPQPNTDGVSHSQTSNNLSGTSSEDPLGNFGRVVSVRRMGFNQFRIFCNVGTDLYPLYKSVNSSDIGKNTGQRLFNEMPVSEPFDIKKRKANHVKRVIGSIDTCGKTKSGRRTPAYLFIEYHEDLAKNPHAQSLALREWITRSDAIRLLGKKPVEGEKGHFATGTVNNLKKTEYFAKCREKGIHPDTQRPVTDTEKAQLRWIFDPVSPDLGTVPGEGDWEPPSI